MVERLRTPETSPQKDLGLRVFSASVASSLHPERNEDSIFYLEYSQGKPALLAMVLDGVGGLEAGDVASRTGVEAIKEALIMDFSKSRGVPSLRRRQCGSSEHHALEFASRSVSEKTKGQTTATVIRAFADSKGRVLGWASVGDSRLYLMRNGNLEQINIEDKPLVDLRLDDVEKKAISKQLDEVITEGDLKNLPFRRLGDVMDDYDIERYLGENEMLEETRERGMYEYLYSKRNYINQSLGSLSRPDVNGSRGILSLKLGDAIVLTTDGVHDNLTPTEIRDILLSSTLNPAEALTEASAKRAQEEHLRAKPDDMSAIVIKVERRKPLKINPQQ